jgi:CHAT domain-containing protein
LIKIAFVLLQFIISDNPAKSQSSASGTIIKYFKEAKKLYDLSNPTESSDAMALEYFLIVANSNERKVNVPYRVESLIKAGNIHQGYGRFKESQVLYHRALFENQKSSTTELEYEAYLYLGSSLYFNGVLDSAKHYFEKAAEIAVAYKKILNLPEQDRLYNSLGAIYYEGANYQQAKNYFAQALALTSTTKEDYNDFFVTLKSNIANCLIRINQYDSAIQIFRSLNPGPGQKSIVNQNLAHAYFEKGAYDSALNIYKSTKLAGGLYKVVALNDIGRIYMRKSMYREAGIFLDSALSQNNILTGNLNNREAALSYLYKAELAQKQNQTDEALLLCNKALRVVHLNFNTSSELEIPVEVSNSLSPITFYKILVFKADLIYKKYLRLKTKELLSASLLTYVKAFETANFISKNFDNDDAKIFFLGNSKLNYEKAMEVAYENCKLDKSFHQQALYILESYKGNVLRQNLEYNKIINNAGIPDSLVKKENELKSLYAAYLTKLNLATNANESKNIQNRLNSLMVELSGIQRGYEKYESYNRIRQNTDDFNILINDIQASIGKKISLLNYFVTDTCIYIYLLTNKYVKLEKVLITDTFKTALTRYFSESLSIQEGERFTGYAASNIIFQNILKPVYDKIKNIENLVIVPDAYLFYIPFDALVKTAGKKDYLLYSHAVSFHYSVSLFLEKLGRQTVSVVKNDSTLAFAPFSGSSEGRNPFPDYLTLPYSLEEIDNPYSRKFSDASATKEEFFKQYNRYNIFHLATHASLGKDSSSNWIQFYPDSNSQSKGRLYTHEIYNMHLSLHELVILSACESGSGQTIEGEGLLSISRAFMYAGAEGIISTLYKTDDLVTAFLMKRLFSYIQEGLPPEQALRKSKIDLLESGEINLRFKAPNYWSNFIYVGKVVPQKKSTWKTILLVSMLILIIPLAIKKIAGK